MSILRAGLRGHAALQALARPQRRIHFAHADLAGYLGVRGGLLPRHAGAAVVASLRDLHQPLDLARIHRQYRPISSQPVGVITASSSMRDADKSQ